VIWTGHPFSTYSRVETTFIEGDVYFDRAKDLAMRADLAKEKRDRLKKEADEEAKNKKGKKGGDNDEKKEPANG
jgi:hypothetical protein